MRKNKYPKKEAVVEEIVEEIEVAEEAPSGPVIHTNQRWIQASSKRCASYDEARALYDASTEERKRIRFRPPRGFDFVVYEKLPSKEKAA